MNTAIGGSSRGLEMDFSEKHPSVKFLIYEDFKYLGESAFHKNKILIGKGLEADLVLDHQAVADVHALVQVQRGQAFIINKNISNGLRLNGLSVKKSQIFAEDIIQLGPFSIIFKHEPKSIESVESSNLPLAGHSSKQTISKRVEQRQDAGWESPKKDFSVILVNEYPSEQSRRRAIENLAKLLGTGYEKVSRVLRKPRHLLKENLDRASAERLETSLQKAGILCLLANAEGESPSGAFGPVNRVAAPAVEKYYSHAPSKIQDCRQVTLKDHTNAIAAEEHPPAEEHTEIEVFSITGSLWVDDEEEEDEEAYEAPFSLMGELTGSSTPKARAQRPAARVHITKTIGATVVDSCFLDKGRKYFIQTEQGRLCLAEHKSNEAAYAFVSPNLSGYLASDDQRRTDLSTYRTKEYLHRRRKQIFRVPLSKSETAVLSDGGCRYTIHLAESVPSPEVGVAPAAKSMEWRHWAYSGAAHLFLLICFSIYLYFHGSVSQKPAPHFVKIDLASLRAPEPKKEIVPPPKVEPPPPKPEPVRVAEKVKPPEKKVPKKVVSPPPVKTAKAKKRPKKVASARKASRHPKAGGGFGKGNVANRNVNQTGILSILGKSAVSGPSAAIASVTNIDAVKVPGATGKNFTVGGIKGSVGTGKISMGASGGIVATKSSTQVLRSAGASGPGTVAALEKGSIGQNHVKGMVTAKLTRTVKVEGGMSREMVKRVIDQHMGEITYCYESALVGNPTISGRVIFEWKILMGGQVGEIRIMSSSINSHEVHDCIKSAIRSWRFPKPVGSEVVVSYPFVFDLVAF